MSTEAQWGDIWGKGDGIVRRYTFVCSKQQKIRANPPSARETQGEESVSLPSCMIMKILGGGFSGNGGDILNDSCDLYVAQPPLRPWQWTRCHSTKYLKFSYYVIPARCSPLRTRRAASADFVYARRPNHKNFRLYNRVPYSGALTSQQVPHISVSCCHVTTWSPNPLPVRKPWLNHDFETAIISDASRNNQFIKD